MLVRYSLFLGSLKDWKWFIKEQPTLWHHLLYFSSTNQYSLGGGSIPKMLVSRYELSLYHIPIKSNLLGFLGIDVFACGLLDRVINKFAPRVNFWNKSRIKWHALYCYRRGHKIYSVAGDYFTHLNVK